MKVYFREFKTLYIDEHYISISKFTCKSKFIDPFKIIIYVNHQELIHGKIYYFLGYLMILIKKLTFNIIKNSPPTKLVYSHREVISFYFKVDKFDRNFLKMVGHQILPGLI
jgi:hypothetical protein